MYIGWRNSSATELVIIRTKVGHIHGAAGCALHNKPGPCSECVETNWNEGDDGYIGALPCCADSGSSLPKKSLRSRIQLYEAKLLLADKPSDSSAPYALHRSLLSKTLSVDPCRFLFGTMSFYVGTSSSDVGQVSRHVMASRITAPPRTHGAADSTLLPYSNDPTHMAAVFSQLLYVFQKNASKGIMGHISSEVDSTGKILFSITLSTKARFKEYQRLCQFSHENPEHALLVSLDATGKTVTSLNQGLFNKVLPSRIILYTTLAAH
jgi:hypothetical protein